MTTAAAFGEFILKSGNTYRQSAFIQWGTSTKSIGACLLLNPGSAEFDPKSQLYQQLITEGYAKGDVRVDPTMDQLIKFVEQAYDSSKLDGRFHIYNLFTLQNARSSNALEEFERLARSGEYQPESVLPSLEDIQQNPWILLGWGCDEKSFPQELVKVKEEYLRLIAETGIQIFGKKHPKNQGYYHPCPLIPTQRPKIISDLVQIYRANVHKKL